MERGGQEVQRIKNSAHICPGCLERGCVKKSDKDGWNQNAAALEYGGPLSIFE